MIPIFTKNGQIHTKVENLKFWDKNPRTVSDERFEDLLQQLKLGQYKPLLAMDDGTVIGGNVRLRAYQKKGLQETPVNIVEAVEFTEGEVRGYVAKINGQLLKNPKVYGSRESMMMEYALSDNDHVGVTDMEMIANSMPEYEIDWDLYNVHSDEGIDLGDFTLGTDLKKKEEDSKAPRQKIWGVFVGCADQEEAYAVLNRIKNVGFDGEVREV